MERITKNQVEQLVSLINKLCGFQENEEIFLQKVYGHYNLEKRIPGTTGVTDVKNGLSLREAYTYLQGMLKMHDFMAN